MNTFLDIFVAYTCLFAMFMDAVADRPVTWSLLWFASAAAYFVITSRREAITSRKASQRSEDEV
jgi:hypothetical protein